MSHSEQDAILSFLSEKLQSAAGDESVFAACDAMYSASFICGETFKAGEIDAVERRDLEFSVKAHIAAERGILPPEVCWMSDDDDSEWEYDSWHSEVDAIVVDPVAEETLLIELCNYKGEGEGYAVYETVKNLPRFVSKSHSAAHFGA
jgi:hypothetical protein